MEIREREDWTIASTRQIANAAIGDDGELDVRAILHH